MLKSVTISPTHGFIFCFFLRAMILTFIPSWHVGTHDLRGKQTLKRKQRKEKIWKERRSRQTDKESWEERSWRNLEKVEKKTLRDQLRNVFREKRKQKFSQNGQRLRLFCFVQPPWARPFFAVLPDLHS